MSDEEKQELVSEIIHRQRYPSDLTDEEFVNLLDSLKRMYNARIFNCVDASAKWDKEWAALSDVFYRAHKIIEKKERTEKE